MAQQDQSPQSSHGPQGSLATLTVAALGIVFGDIGTSPLYAVKTVVHLSGATPTPTVALGLLSLMIWGLTIIVTIKYVSFLLRFHNRGEGGVLSLLALLGGKKKHRSVITAIALFGAALIYSDGAITPAISVLSALEGLEIVAPSLSHYILPLAVAILILLFAVQSRGTEKIGRFFGPIMILWFVVIAILGIMGIAKHPSVLAAINPWYGLHYLFTHGLTGFLTLGGVFLCVTGAEALYADMGHVGEKSTRIAWYSLVMPSLILNYAGQIALLLSGQAEGNNLFYQLCPPIFLLPLIILATCSTVIASQAIISGAFSMTRQAILLGWFPRLNITQTSSTGYGKIYVSVVNWLLMMVTVALTLSFRTSDNLAAAYGIAVSLTLLITTLLLYVAVREIWRWPRFIALPVVGILLIIDTAFLGANLFKVKDGGWVPLVISSVIFTLMAIWQNGSKYVTSKIREAESLFMFFYNVWSVTIFPAYLAWLFS